MNGRRTDLCPSHGDLRNDKLWNEYLNPKQKPETQLLLPLTVFYMKVMARAILDIRQCQEQQRREKKKEVVWITLQSCVLHGSWSLHLSPSAPSVALDNTSHYSKQIEASSEHSKLKHTWMHVYVQPSVSINVRQTGEVKLLLGKAVVLPKPKWSRNAGSASASESKQVYRLSFPSMNHEASASSALSVNLRVIQNLQLLSRWRHETLHLNKVGMCILRTLIVCASIFLGHLDPGCATRTRGSPIQVPRYLMEITPLCSDCFASLSSYGRAFKATDILWSLSFGPFWL